MMMCIMAVLVMEFQAQVYKIQKILCILDKSFFLDVIKLNIHTVVEKPNDSSWIKKSGP